MMTALIELSKPRTKAQAETMATECVSEKMQREFMSNQGARIGRARAWDLWRGAFVQHATGQPWAFAHRGIRAANLVLKAAI